MSEWTISDDKVMEIWLHSLNYHTLGKEFKSNLPYWAYPELNF
jgi:hypothetical protein